MVDNKKMKTLENEIIRIPKGAIHVPDPNLRPWNEMTWEDVYEEHKQLVPKAAKGDEMTDYYYDFDDKYTPKLVASIEADCVEGLREIVDSYRYSGTLIIRADIKRLKGLVSRHRVKVPEDAQPIDCNWHDILWSDFKEVIQKKLFSNEQVLKTFGRSHDITAVNFAIVVENKYRATINDRNMITPYELIEYQNGR